MKTVTTNRSWRMVAAMPAALLLLLLAGCLEKKLVWSPDGARAAVISQGALYLCAADGNLSPRLVPDVYLVAWLSDSQQLVLARKRSVDQWTPIAKALGPEQAEALSTKAESIWQKYQKGGLWSVLTLEIGKEGGDAMKIYLRERYEDALRAKLNRGEWDDIASKKVEIHELVMARIDGDKIVTGAPLHEGLGEIEEIRPAPGDKTVAYVTEMTPDRDKGHRLMVVPVNASAPVVVADRVATYPDWTADGRSLAYVQASGTPSGKDDLLLGVLVQRGVLDDNGRINIATDQKYLAGWVFAESSRVRCLRDGRILFNAAEINFPIAAEDYGEQREQLFAVDLARQPTLVRMIPRKKEQDLPQSLTFFEVSPDERQVLFGTFKGNVCLLTLATGGVQEIQAGIKDNLQGAPVWRKAGEFTYTRRNVTKDGKKPVREAEVILRSGKTEKVLSQSWPDAMVNELFSSENQK